MSNRKTNHVENQQQQIPADSIMIGNFQATLDPVLNESNLTKAQAELDIFLNSNAINIQSKGDVCIGDFDFSIRADPSPK